MIGSPDAPFFLVGAERSGTTLLRLMLDHHPELAFRNEFEFAVDRVGDDGSFPDVRAYADTLRLSRTFAMSGFTIDESLDYPALVRSFLEQKRANDGKRLVGATVHRHFERILAVWPEARFIHLVRDGRDVALSRVQMGWAGNGWAAAGEWASVEGELSRLRERTGDERFIRVTFEELLSDPRATLTKLCAFMGIEYDDAMLSYDEHSTYDKPSAGAVARWVRHPNTREIRLIEGVQREQLVRSGYELSEPGPAVPGTIEHFKLSMHDRYGKARFRMRRFGVRLWLASLVSSRIGPNGWRERVQLQINEVQRRHLK